MKSETEIIDKLFLELSQFSSAITEREQAAICRAERAERERDAAIEELSRWVAAQGDPAKNTDEPTEMDRRLAKEWAAARLKAQEQSK